MAPKPIPPLPPVKHQPRVADHAAYGGTPASARAQIEAVGPVLPTLAPQDGDTLVWSAANGVWEAGAGGGGAGLTRSYGDGAIVMPGMTAFPLILKAALYSMNMSGGHVDLLESFDTTYRMCLVRLRVVDTPSGTLLASTQQRFANFAAVQTWVDANTPNNGSFFSANVFFDVADEIDSSVPVPTKLYGKNRLWAGLTNKASGHYYWRPKTTSCKFAGPPYSGSGGATLERAKVLKGIWEGLYPALPLSAPALWTEAEFSLFWISGDRRSRYDMPLFLSQALTVVNMPASDRYSWDGASATQAPLGSNWAYDQTTVEKCYYGSISSTSCNLSSHFGMRAAFKNLGPAILSGESVVVGYPMTDTVSGGHAVIIRPVGVDQWYVDNWDTTLYRLEAVGTTRHDERPKIRAINGLTQVPDRRVAGPFNAFDIGYCFGNTNNDRLLAPGKHSLSTGSVRLQYRNVNTGKVSPLSIPGIVPVVRKRARPFSLLVVNTHTV